MAPDDNSGARPAGPVVLRIKLRYDDVDAMVQRFASNVGKSGLFLPTKAIQPVGTEVKFELRLANDVPVLVGLGRVKHVRHPDPDNPRASFGMGIELMRVSREGREVIIRMLERRRALGLPEVAIPLPEDLESARRAEVDTQPRADAAAVVREAMPQAQATSAPLLTSVRPGSGPIAIARDSQSGRVAVPILAPEKSRPRRPRVHELIERATELSARIVVTATPELDIHVDIDRVLSRARALAGGDLDGELAILREAAAAPVEVGVDAASAELARQLGGKPISKRERSARWAPPPAIELKPEQVAMPDFAERVRAETEAAPSATIAAVVEAALDQQASVEAELKTPVDPSPSLVPQEAYVIRKSAEIVAQQDAEDYDGAFAQNASTTTAVEPQQIAKGFGPEVKTDPAERNGLMIDDDADVSSFERELDAARIHTGVSAAAPERPGDDLFEDDRHAVLLRSSESSLEDAAERTQIGSPLAEREIADGMGYEIENEQEISDLDVLAEADEDDEDLMRAHGEAEVSSGHAAPAPEYQPYETPQPPGDEPVPPPEAYPAPEPYTPYETPQPPDDFAARLDLGDDDDVPPPPSDDIDRNEAREFDAHVPYQRARRASSEGSYTYAEAHVPQSVPHFAPHATGEEFDEPHSHAPTPAPARGPDPRLLKHGRPTTTGEELEDALAALDAGDIDLEQQRRRTRRPTPGASSGRPLPGLPMESSGPRPLPGVPMESSGPRPLPGVSPDRPMDSSGSRPLPGLPVERPRTGPVPVVQRPPTNPQRVAHTVRRSEMRNTGSQPIQPQHPTGPQPQILAHDPQARSKPPTGQQPVAQRPPSGQQPARSKPPTGQVSTAKPPPIPAAARKGGTQQVPLAKPATQPVPVAKRPPTDDGVLIDFDEDE